MKGQNILCISNTTWYGPFTKSTVQIMSRLAKQNKVLFVEYPYTIKDVVFTLVGKGKAPISRILGFKSRMVKIPTGQDSWVYQLVVPPVLPCDFIKSEALFRFVFDINSKIYLWCISKALKNLKMENLISISAYNPYYGLSLQGKLNERLNIYYSYDGPNIRRHGPRVITMDAAYATSTDAVITTSDFLAAEKKRYNTECYVVKNGVDFETFRKHARPENLKHDKVTIGYIGSMDFRFDIDMVEAAVKALPDYFFHFVGIVRNETIKNTLVKHPNTRFFPPVAPEEIPEILCRFNAGIIPYLQNEINRNIYPLKINEYLAVGVPVIMSKFAYLPEFEHIVDMTPDTARFIERIRYQVEEDDTSKIARRIEFASKNSWDHRADEFATIIQGLLNNVKTK